MHRVMALLEGPALGETRRAAEPLVSGTCPASSVALSVALTLAKGFAFGRQDGSVRADRATSVEFGVSIAGHVLVTVVTECVCASGWALVAYVV